MRSPFAVLLAPLMALLALLSAVSALQENLAGIVDWHRALIGTPLRSAPPQFVDIGGQQAIVAVTDKKVLTVLEENGDVRWRQNTEAAFEYWVEKDGECLPSSDFPHAAYPAHGSLL